MSSFWSNWVIVLTAFNLVFTIVLFVWGLRVTLPTQADGTSGRKWAHGVLREGVRNLPTWWILLSIVVLGVGCLYLVLYQGFGSVAGELKWSSHAQLARETAANNVRLDPELQRLASAPVEQLATDSAALRIGGRLFADNCAACHGAQGLGNQSVGAPNLADADWLYGGDGETIVKS